VGRFFWPAHDCIGPWGRRCGQEQARSGDSVKQPALLAGCLKRKAGALNRKKAMEKKAIVLAVAVVLVRELARVEAGSHYAKKQ
jgi:hypothetical protein